MPTATHSIEPDDLPHLADILGQTDAIFAPVRNWSDESSCNTYTGRRDYPSMGIRWEYGGGTHSDRKRMQWWLENAAERGLIVRFRGGAFTTRLRLTEVAELATRAACGLPGLYGAVLLTREVGEYEYTHRDDVQRDDKVWVREYPELCGGEQNDHRVIVEEMAYPALLRDWLRASSDLSGLVRYCLGDVPAPTTPPAELPSGDRGGPLANTWADSLRKALGLMGKATHGQSRELGYIPLIAGIGGVRKKRRRKVK